MKRKPAKAKVALTQPAPADAAELKQKLAAGVVITPALLPIHESVFCSCSLAIKRAANARGAALPLPTPLLPPM
jgi:hypothetical protein